ncbi:MAG: arsenate reductase (glutaredoxin) [Pseudomonadota bacterium]
MSVTIWHNPRCSKSRRALAIVREQGIEPEIVEYLNDPPSMQQLRDVVELTGKKPSEFVRTGEKVFKELELKGSDDDTLLAAMSANPILIERAIVFANGKAIIARPPEDVTEIL